MPHFRKRIFIASWLWLIVFIAMVLSYRNLPLWAKITGTVILVILTPAGLGDLVYRRQRNLQDKD